MFCVRFGFTPRTAFPTGILGRGVTVRLTHNHAVRVEGRPVRTQNHSFGVSSEVSHRSMAVGGGTDEQTPLNTQAGFLLAGAAYLSKQFIKDFAAEDSLAFRQHGK